MLLRQFRSHSFTRTFLLPIAIVATMAVVLLFGVDRVIHSIVVSTIQTHAMQKSATWSKAVTAEHPALTQLSHGSTLTPLQAEMLGQTVHGSDIFLFKIFGPEGRELITSDNVYGTKPKGEVNQTARSVFETNTPYSEFFANSERGDRPAAYVESYIVIQDSSGAAIGVAEAYVDVTALDIALHGTFYTLSTALVFGCAVIYLLPSLFLIYRNDQLRQRDRALLHLSLCDVLTGALNRRAFNDQMEAAFSARAADGKPLGFMFIDVDFFKSINDEHGHDYGDQFLKHIAGVISTQVRSDDIFGRFGGDEFVLITQDRSAKALQDFAQKIQTGVSRPFTYAGQTTRPRLSIGTHISPSPESSKQAMHCADLALYQAKAAGRNRIVAYDSRFDAALQRKRHVDSSLRAGLTGQGLYLDFQPVFRNNGTLIAGFEALLRLTDDAGEQISPAEFIPIAENAGLINDIGHFALCGAVAAAKSWPDDTFVAVNLSAVQFKAGTLVETVGAVLETTGFPAHRLELEVTESLLLEDEERVGRQISGLKTLGVSMALDDFGTGYSSLGYLWKYQFDKLKVDRVFLEGYDFYTAKYRDIISAIVMLGHRLGMEVTVEGIEKPDQLDMLAKLGCDTFQGYLLGRPMTPESVEKLLAGPANGSVQQSA